MPYKYNPLTGKFDYYEPSSPGSSQIGCPTDGTYEDGAADVECTDSIADAVDKVNETLSYLLPDPPQPLSGLNFTTSRYTGYIANHPSLNFLTAGQQHDYIFITPSISATNTNHSDSFSKADKGTLKLNVNSTEVDSFDLESHFNESEREGNQTYPPANSPANRLTVTFVGMYNDFPAYQKGNVDVNLTASDIQVGENSIQLIHEVDTQQDSTPTYVVFYDDAVRPNVTTFTASLNTGNIKHLSGIRYYNQNTSWNIAISVSGVFDKTYVQRPVRFYSSAHNTVDIDWNSSSASGFSNPPNWDDSWNYFASHMFDKITAGDTLVFSCQPRDPMGWGNLQQDIKNNCLFNTYANISTDTHEYFVDENYRLPESNFNTIPSSITGQWDSTLALANGQAQVYVDRLVYPHQDFTSGWDPTQQSGTNYSAFNGPQRYFRAFRDNNIPHNSGVLHIRGITWSDLNVNVQLELKLPTQTGWLDLSKDYNSATFTGADGDGAMTGHSQSGDVLSIAWSSGTYSTANAGYMYILRVTMLNTNNQIYELWDFE